jgi:hypothetical protein
MTRLPDNRLEIAPPGTKKQEMIRPPEIKQKILGQW